LIYDITSHQNERQRNWFGQICAVIDYIKALFPKLLLKKFFGQKFCDLPFEANIHLKISYIQRAEEKQF
jgi:hypothetical protein